MLLGIIVSTPEEVKPLLDVFDFENVETGIYMAKINKTDSIICVLSGIGKVNAQNATWRLASFGVDRVMNIGTCVSLKGKSNVGEVVFPNLFFDGDFDLSEEDISSKDPANVNMVYYKGEVVLPKNKVECYSYSTYNVHKRAEGALVDMECYSIVSACKVIGLKCLVAKIISDGSTAEEVWNAQTRKVIESVIKDYDKSYVKAYKYE